MLALVAALAAQLTGSSSLPRRLTIAATLGFAATFAVLLAYGRPGLGIGGVFYLPIILAALAGGPVTGAVTGALALSLYEVGLVFGRHTTWQGFTGLTIHLATFVLAGTMVGYFASRARRMMSDSLAVLNELLVLARRDVLTGVSDSAGFYSAISTRIGRGATFGVLLGEAAEPVRDEHRLRELSRALLVAEVDGELARLGASRFALLVRAPTGNAARSAADALERTLAAAGTHMTFGWAAHPSEGTDALALVAAATERLCARRVVRGEWRPTPASAGLVEELKAV